MDIVIYGKKGCVGCDQSKALLDSKGITYEYVDVMVDRVAQSLFRENGWRAVPQITIDNAHVGGFDALKQVIDTIKIS